MPNLKKLECLNCDFSKNETYRDELFKLLKGVEVNKKIILQVVDKLNREGDEIDTTFNEDDDGDEGILMEFNKLDIEDGDGEGEEGDSGEEDYEEEDDEDDDEEEEAPKKSTKKPKTK